jgi:outer membrane immunogenic protein
MKSLTIYTVLLATATSVSIGAANAQSTTFEGAYGQLGIGFESISPSFSNSGVNVTGYGFVPYNTSIDSSNGLTGTITAGYMFPVSKDFLFGIGAEYSPLASQSSNYTVGVTGLGTAQGAYKKENSYNIFVSPATPIGTDGLLYGKLGYTGASIKSSLGSSSASQSYTGYSLGLGYKQFITGGLYGFAEGNYFNYGNKTNSNSGTILGAAYTETQTTSANAYNFLVGIGYRF